MKFMDYSQKSRIKETYRDNYGYCFGNHFSVQGIDTTRLGTTLLPCLTFKIHNQCYLLSSSVKTYALSARLYKVVDSYTLAETKICAHYLHPLNNKPNSVDCVVRDDVRSNKTALSTYLRSRLYSRSHLNLPNCFWDLKNWFRQVRPAD